MVHWHSWQRPSRITFVHALTRAPSWPSQIGISENLRRDWFEFCYLRSQPVRSPRFFMGGPPKFTRIGPVPRVGFSLRVPGRGATTGVAKMPPTNPTSSVITEQLTRALGEAVVRIWSNLPQEVQNHLFQEAVTSQGESIRSQLAVFLHDKHSRTADPLGKPREMPEPDSLGG